MLNVAWKLFAKHFNQTELGIRKEFIEEYWKSED
jgi:vacuolar-type H+-ATPase subunit B/Vma2